MKVQIGFRRKAITPRGHGEEGNAMIETALVLPMLLGIITAIFGFGIGYNNQLTLTSAVGSSAQRLQLLRNTTTDPCLDAFTAITSAAPGLNSSKITMTYSFNGTAVTPVQNSCSGEQTLLVSGQPVTVTAKYPCAPPVYGATLSSSCQLSATVTEYEY